ncbi:unnamed protein product [Ambrosiozyma monospora]|uniref:Unnamed protein product n=1 Tax=Ambrosiozyma monospora TaxID=43982 RepID=A0A9W6YPC7_AMBMO|nr:unnamed protein product [Ambrosiozyma monospora]
MSEPVESTHSVNNQTEQQTPEMSASEKLKMIMSRIADAAIAEADAIADGKFDSADHYYKISSALDGISVESPFDLNIGTKLTKYQTLKSDDARKLHLVDISATASAIIKRFRGVVGSRKFSYIEKIIAKKMEKNDELNEQTEYNRYTMHFILSLPILQYLAIPAEGAETGRDSREYGIDKDTDDNTNEISQTNDDQPSQKKRKTTFRTTEATGSTNKILEAAKPFWFIWTRMPIQVESMLRSNFESFLKNVDYSSLDGSELEDFPLPVSPKILTQFTNEDECGINLKEALLLELEGCVSGSQIRKEFPVKERLANVLPDYLTKKTSSSR